jgi:putative RNA 2'-phosphotransferase
MLNEKENAKISRFLSLVLRHKPEAIGIKLDEQGWTDVESLLEKSNPGGFNLDKTILKHIVETNSKRRFAFNETGDKIRANQGHSVDVKLGYNSRKPPRTLYHGTGEKSVASILQTGLQRRGRHHVHLSSGAETAFKVGQRHGKPVVFEVSAQRMFDDGHEFFLSENGVWLTDHVPATYLKKAAPNRT